MVAHRLLHGIDRVLFVQLLVSSHHVGDVLGGAPQGPHVPGGVLLFSMRPLGGAANPHPGDRVLSPDIGVYLQDRRRPDDDINRERCDAERSPEAAGGG
jgi:hypothetical protein